MISMVQPTPVQQQPQSRLSLDLSNTQSFNIAGPNSPATSEIYSGLPSPTLSGSFNTNKSHAELTALLKDAYNVIKEKERDLTLAAEIGKSLLENNISLKSKYEALAVQLQHQRQRQKGANYDKPGITRIAPPSNSLGGLEEEPSDYDEDDSDNDSVAGYSSGIEIPSLVRSRSPARIGMTQKEFENIKELEIANIELTSRLETMINENQENEKVNRAKIRRLESELARLQETYVQATEKIETLEQDNQRLIKKQSTDFWNLKYNRKSTDNDDVIEKLLTKVEELETSNLTLERSKAEIDKRLERTVKELGVLRQKYDEIEQAAKDYNELQERYKQQAEQVTELTMILEEQRAMNMGMRSGMHSRAGSFSEGALRRLSNPDAAALRGITPAAPGQGPQKIVRRTLLDELENEWYRELALFQRERKRSKSGESPPFSPVMSESDLSEFYAHSGAMSEAGDDVMSAIDYMSEDEFTFLEEFNEDEVEAMLRREWFFRRWARAVYRFLRWIWRWCRFLVLLCAAVLMALYRGPDDVLPNEM